MEILLFEFRYYVMRSSKWEKLSNTVTRKGVVAASAYLPHMFIEGGVIPSGKSTMTLVQLGPPRRFEKDSSQEDPAVADTNCSRSTSTGSKQKKT